MSTWNNENVEERNRREREWETKKKENGELKKINNDKDWEVWKIRSSDDR